MSSRDTAVANWTAAVRLDKMLRTVSYRTDLIKQRNFRRLLGMKYTGIL